MLVRGEGRIVGQRRGGMIVSIGRDECRTSLRKVWSCGALALNTKVSHADCRTLRDLVLERGFAY